MSKSLVGEKFGKLTVIKDSGSRDSNSSIKYLCECDCGNTTLVSSHNLRSGNTKSCSCLVSENGSKAIKRVNDTGKLKEHRDKVIVEGTNLDSLTRRIGKNNISGVKGVSYEKAKGKWRAQLNLKGERYNLGTFSNKQDAINARLEAEEKHFKPILEKYIERN